MGSVLLLCRIVVRPESEIHLSCDVDRNHIVGILVPDISCFSECIDNLCSGIFVNLKPLTNLLVRGIFVMRDMIDKYIHIFLRDALNLYGIKRSKVMYAYRERRLFLLIRGKALIVRLDHIIIEPELIVLIIVNLNIVLVIAVLLTETLVDLAIAFTELICSVSAPVS